MNFFKKNYALVLILFPSLLMAMESSTDTIEILFPKDNTTVIWPRAIAELSPTLKNDIDEKVFNENGQLVLPNTIGSDSIKAVQDVLSSLSKKIGNKNKLSQLMALTDPKTATTCLKLITAVFNKASKTKNFANIAFYLDLPLLSTMYSLKVVPDFFQGQENSNVLSLIKNNILNGASIKRVFLNLVSVNAEKTFKFESNDILPSFDGKLVCKRNYEIGNTSCQISSIDNKDIIKFEIKLPPQELAQIEWSPDNKTLIWLNEAGDIKWLNTETEEVSSLKNESKISLVHGWFNCDGTKLIIKRKNNSELYLLFLFDIVKKSLEKLILNNFSEKNMELLVLEDRLFFNNQCTSVILKETLPWTEKLIILDINTYSEHNLNIYELPTHIFCGPINKLICVEEKALNTTMSVLNTDTGELLFKLIHDDNLSFKTCGKKNNYIYSFSKDGRELITIAQGGTLYIWSLIDGTCKKKLKIASLKFDDIFSELVSCDFSSGILTIIISRSLGYAKCLYKYNLYTDEEKYLDTELTAEESCLLLAISKAKENCEPFIWTRWAKSVYTQFGEKDKTMGDTFRKLIDQLAPQ